MIFGSGTVAGTPMLLAGDEFGNSQHGNNNAYAQDNELGWLDWGGLETDPDFFYQVQGLLRLRRELPHLASEVYLHGHTKNDAGWFNIEWLNTAGKRMKLNQWHKNRTLTLLCPDMNDKPVGDSNITEGAVAVMFNAADETLDFNLPVMTQKGSWSLVFHSTRTLPSQTGPVSWRLSSRSITCATWSRQKQ